MPDREKVIKGWECHMEADTLKCADCPYREGWRTCNYADTLYKDVYALLKEREPIEPVDDGHGSLICGNQGYECGCVGRYDLTTKVVEKYCNFCPECGRKVKWDEIN